jgi:hypothetical protein
MPGKIKDVSNQPFNELTAIKFIKRDQGSVKINMLVGVVMERYI